MSHLDDAKRVQVTREQARILSTKQKIRFLEMLKRRASQFEFRNKMNLRPSDIGDIRRSFEQELDIKVETIRDMNRAIAVLQKQLDRERLQEVGKDHAAPIKRQDDAPPKQKSTPENKPVVNAVPPNFHAKQAAKRRQKYFDLVAKDEMFCDYQIPAKDQNRFLRSLHLGKRILSRMYSVPTRVIVKEALRLDPKLDPDSLNT